MLPLGGYSQIIHQNLSEIGINGNSKLAVH